MMNLLIACPCDFQDFSFVDDVMMDYLGRFMDQIEIQVITSGTRGLTSMGQRFAQEHDLDVRVVPAGPNRNEKMVQRAGTLVAFWDGRSPGVKQMIDAARETCLAVKVVRLDCIEMLAAA